MALGSALAEQKSGHAQFAMSQLTKTGFGERLAESLSISNCVSRIEQSEYFIFPLTIEKLKLARNLNYRLKFPRLSKVLE